MGHWQPRPQTVWPLHLKSAAAGTEQSITDGLPSDLAALGRSVGGAAASHLTAAQNGIDDAVRAFPDHERIIAALAGAAAALEAAAANLAADQAIAAGHRIGRKLREIDAALLLAAGIRGTAWLSTSAIPAGGATELCVHTEPEGITQLPVADGALSVGAPTSRDGIARYPVAAAADAAPTSPFLDGDWRLAGNGLLAVEISADIGGRRASAMLDLEEAAAIVPARSVAPDPEVVIVPLPARPEAVAVTLNVEGTSGPTTIGTVDGLAITPTAAGVTMTPRSDLRAGGYRLPIRVGGEPAYRQVPIAYPHIGRTRTIVPAMLDVLALDLALPEAARVGYVGGGADRVGLWLARMGLAADELDAAALADDLSRYTTIVVGVFAYGLRPDLAAATDRIHAWVRAGGHLVTLYHRPADGWDPNHTPPAPIVIGSPSIRWRVTDPAAEIAVLAPDHPLLNTPNRIGPEDWSAWDKERGLYFAADWDPAYTALISLHDRGEAPLSGALLSASVGRGRHTHTSLVLHHQMDRLVPGAFRLMANLTQPA
jgi:hypothetical protein